MFVSGLVKGVCASGCFAYAYNQYNNYNVINNVILLSISCVERSRVMGNDALRRSVEQYNPNSCTEKPNVVFNRVCGEYYNKFYQEGLKFMFRENDVLYSRYKEDPLLDSDNDKRKTIFLGTAAAAIGCKLAYDVLISSKR